MSSDTSVRNIGQEQLELSAMSHNKSVRLQELQEAPINKNPFAGRPSCCSELFLAEP